MKLSDRIASVLDSKEHKEVYSVGPEQAVYDAIKSMAEHGIGALVVLSQNALVGIVSERDYARKVILRGKASTNTPVSEIMTGPVVYVTREQRVDECMATMTERRFRHLPVVADGIVVGMVSIGDLVKWIISGQEQTIRELECYIAGEYPR
jgi:CBS domain-containing protein